MSDSALPLRRRGFGRTTRTDAWWVQPLLVFGGLTAFLVYANLRVLEGRYYHYDGNGAHYLTPFYSPLLFDTPADEGGPVGGSGHAWLAHKPRWLPGFVSAAAIILVFPAGFRFTCYYYRGAYYKAFWQDPPACAVGEPRTDYRGEAKLPLILQNVHRYFLYVALLFLLILAHDAWKAMWFTDHATGQAEFGIGVGTLVLLVNPILLAGYTFGCHSFRHLIGGSRNVLSTAPLRKRCYDCASGLNTRHLLWAWMSLFWVAFTDVYVRMCATGHWPDWRLL